MTAELRQPPALRNAPRQQRSRERLALVLDAAERLIEERGYDAFTTTAVAGYAGLPASAVYRWFADKDELATAILVRHNERLDEGCAAALGRLESPTLAGAVRAIHDTYVAYYREHRSHVVLWFEGRIGPASVTEVRRHTDRVVADTRAYAVEHGLLPASVSDLDVRVVAEAVDRIHELAFRDDPRGDDRVLDRAVRLALAYYAGQDGATA